MTFLLADGSNLLWRAALSKMHTEMSRKSDGMKTGAVVVFIKTLLAVAERHSVTRGAVIFDGPGAGFRKLLLPRYKGSREHGLDPEVEAQIPYMKRAVEAAGFSLLYSAPYEADDLLATFATRARKAKEPTVILSDDKDLGCLVYKDLIVQQRPCDAKGGQPAPILNEAAIRKRWEVEPRLIPDIQAFAGDGVDEVVGIVGVGPKYAKEVVAQYGSAESYALSAADGKGKSWMHRAGAMSGINRMVASTRLIDDCVGDWTIKQRPRDWANGLIALLHELEADATAFAVAKRAGISIKRSARVPNRLPSRLFAGRR